jgi:hypothetical protein
MAKQVQSVSNEVDEDIKLASTLTGSIVHIDSVLTQIRRIQRALQPTPSSPPSSATVSPTATAR